MVNLIFAYKIAQLHIALNFIAQIHESDEEERKANRLNCCGQNNKDGDTRNKNSLNNPNT